MGRRRLPLKPHPQGSEAPLTPLLNCILFFAHYDIIKYMVGYMTMMSFRYRFAGIKTGGLFYENTDS